MDFPRTGLNSSVGRVGAARVVASRSQLQPNHRAIAMTNDVSDFTMGVASSANGTKGAGPHLVTADGTNGLVSIDVTDAQNCQILQSLSLGGKVANDVFLCGDRAYAVATDTFYIIDICDPAAMSVIGSVSCTTSLWGVACDASRNLAVAVGDRVLHTIDTATENTPACIGISSDLGGNAEDVCLTGTHALVTAGLGKLRSVDLADPANPSIVSQSVCMFPLAATPILSPSISDALGP